MGETTWGIVLTVDEPPQLVLANVAWHLATGASEVHVYLDRADDPMLPHLKAIDRVHATICDTAYWKIARKGRPAAQTQRQLANTDHAMACAGVDWLAHIDADEFLVQSGSLAAELATQTECEVHFPVCERFYRAGDPPRALFDGVLRHPHKLSHPEAARFYGAAAPYLSAGLIGHRGGKSAVPTGSDFKLGIHTGFRGGRNSDNKAIRHRAASTRLFHFDGLTPLHYLLKLARYARAREQGNFPKARLKQIEGFLAHRTNWAELMAFHDLLRVTPRNVETALRGLGLIAPTPFDPLAQIAMILPKPLDLSVSTFDAELETRFPDLMSELPR